MTPFDEMYIKCTNAADQLPNSGSLYPQKNHVDIIRDYTTSEHVRNVVDLVVKHCTKPTFIPVLDSVVLDTEPDTGSDKIHITSFILCHAVQILLFAPTEWNKDLVYSRHSADYIHRYPSPAVHEGQDMAAVGGFFSLEDLNRAVVLFQYALNRRSRSTTSILANRRPAHVTGQFKGYASPEFASYRTTSGGNAANVGITNAMHFFAMNADGSMDNSEASGSLTGMDAIDVHTDAWDLVASGKANQKVRLHGSKSYPPLDIKTFKMILEGAEKRFGWNDIDEGFIRSTKHRTSFSRFLERSDKQAISQMMSQADGDSTPVQLEVAALNRIMNARQPAREVNYAYICELMQICSEKLSLYPGKSRIQPLMAHQVSDGKSNVQDKASLLSMLEALMEAKDDEKTGRTVILTSYQTLNTREVQKMESHFFFRKQIPTTSAAPNDHSSSVTADISQLGAASASGKRKPVGPSTPQKRRKLTKTTYENVDFRFETDEEVLERISSRQKGEDVTETANDSCLVTFLRGEDLQDFQIYKFPKGTHSGADGNLVEYQLQRSAFDQVEFQFLVVDEAHMAKSANKAWNQTFRLLNWKHLVWVTGTPLSSSLADLTSPLTLMWTAYGLNISKLYNMEFGNLGGIYDLDYDPYLDENHLPGGVTYGILSESLSRQRVGDGWEQIIEIYKTKGLHIWLLNPVFYNIMGEASKWSSDFGKNVTARILNIVCMRRTLYSPIRLPSGELSCPASILPPMTIITEEVCFGPEDREQVRKHGILMARGLSMQDGDKLENVTPTNPSVATVRKEHRVNFAAWRAGILVAHDIRDATLLMGTDEYGEDKDIVHEAFQAIRTAGDLSEANANRLQKKKKVKIGVEKVLYLESMTLMEA
ncbi:hypothetical protein ACHAPX_001711 [Trichoderma viride]